MHNAPPVTCRVGRSSFWLVLNATLWFVGAGVLGVWVTVSRLPLHGLPLLGLLMVLTAWMAWRSWRNMPEGVLSWHGDAWTWLPTGELSAVSLNTLAMHWDGQHAMVLKLQPTERPAFWLCVTRRGNPSKWHDVRRAVYSRAKAKHAGLSANASAMPYPGNATPS
jgi:toxin CptA